MSKISLVCFDWGGVILRICRSWGEGCLAAGLGVRGASATQEFASRRKRISREFETGRLSESSFLERMSEAMDGLYTVGEIERIHHAWLVDEYPGMDRVVDDLLGLGHVQTGMLSNTNSLHWARQQEHPQGTLTHFPTAGRLRHRFASHLMGLAKPDASIFEAFARGVGMSPAEILFFDDLPDNVATAKACGWNAEQIDHTGDTATQIRAHLDRHGVWKP